MVVDISRPLGQFLPDWLLAPGKLSLLHRFMNGVIDRALAQTTEKTDAETESNLNLVQELARKGRGKKVCATNWNLCLLSLTDTYDRTSTFVNKSLVSFFLLQRHVLYTSILNLSWLIANSGPNSNYYSLGGDGACA